jgi:ribosomal protein L7/L12
MFNNSVNEQRLTELEQRVARLEQQVEFLAGRLGLGDMLSERPDMTEIQQLLQRGQKIEAIKVYRQKTGVGLKEAKDAVEAMERGVW